MTVITKTIQVKSAGEGDVINLTEQTSRMVEESRIVDGIVTVFVSGSTAAVTTIEYEPGLKYDFPAMLSKRVTQVILDTSMIILGMTVTATHTFVLPWLVQA